MIRVLLAINFGLAVAAAFAILEAIATEPPRQRRQSELTKMILESSRRMEEDDTTITPEEITEVEIMLGMTPFSMVLTGRYDDAGWPFETITQDAKN